MTFLLENSTVLPLAYLDPGSGAVILQLLVAGVAGAVVWFKYHGKRFFGAIGARKKDETSDGDAD
jgi:hypothetical protein